VNGLEHPTPDPEAPADPAHAGTADVGVEVLRQLRRSGYLALRDVACDVREGHVRLLGRLPSYFLKQKAQAVAAGVEGVREVANLIEVAPPESRPHAEAARTPRAGEPGLSVPDTRVNRVEGRVPPST